MRWQEPEKRTWVTFWVRRGHILLMLSSMYLQMVDGGPTTTHSTIKRPLSSVLIILPLTDFWLSSGWVLGLCTISEIQQLKEQLWLRLVLVNNGVSLGPATPVLAGCLPLLSFSLYFFASSLPPSLISPLHLSQTRTPARPSGHFKRADRACIATLARASLCQTNQHTWFTYRKAGASLATFGTRQEGIRRMVGEMERREEMRRCRRKNWGERLELKKLWRSEGGPWPT